MAENREVSAEVGPVNLQPNQSDVHFLASLGKSRPSFLTADLAANSMSIRIQ